MPFEDFEKLIDTVPGLLHPGQERRLFEMAYSLPDGASILEVGCFKGRSTCAMAFGCQGTTKHIFCIDTFRGLSENTNREGTKTFLGEFINHITRLKLAFYITPLVGKSSDFWEAWDKPLGMLFVDGNHEEDIVMGDVVSFFPHLVRGGILAMHDVYEPNDTPSGPTAVWAAYLSELEDIGSFHNLAYGRKK